MKSVKKKAVKVLVAASSPSCTNCGKQKENLRSFYCRACFEGILKTKVREGETSGS